MSRLIRSVVAEILFRTARFDNRETWLWNWLNRRVLAAPWGWCQHCGDATERGDDPAPSLCLMCQKAGRL